MSIKTAVEKVREMMVRHHALPTCNPQWTSFNRDLDNALAREQRLTEMETEARRVAATRGE